MSESKIYHCTVLPERLPPSYITHVLRSSQLNYIGPAITSTSQLQSLAEYISQRTENNFGAGSHADLIMPILQQFLSLSRRDCLSSNGTQSAAAIWLRIETTAPNQAIGIQGWHRDTAMFIPDDPSAVRSTYITALRGRSTRVIADNDAAGRIMSEFLPRNPQQVRELNQLGLVDVGPRAIVRFTGGSEGSAVHARPACDFSRVVVSVFYGSEGEIRQLESILGWRFGEFRYGKV
jgi:hypothetical protein